MLILETEVAWDPTFLITSPEALLPVIKLDRCFTVYIPDMDIWRHQRVGDRLVY